MTEISRSRWGPQPRRMPRSICAKQTQFPAPTGGARPEGRGAGVIVQNEPNFPARPRTGVGPVRRRRSSHRGSIVRNKANLERAQMEANALQSKGLGQFCAEGRSCETNPICPAVRDQRTDNRPPSPCPLEQQRPADCAKRTQFWAVRAQRLCVQTKPISPVRTGRGAGLPLISIVRNKANFAGSVGSGKRFPEKELSLIGRLKGGGETKPISQAEPAGTAGSAWLGAGGAVRIRRRTPAA